MTWRLQRGNKYGAKRHEYNDYTYHSKLEAGYAAELDLRLRAKDIIGWRRQVPLDITVNGKHICIYRIDFIVEYADGTEDWVEVKGLETETWRLKWKLTEALWGDDPKIRLIVQI